MADQVAEAPRTQDEIVECCRGMGVSDFFGTISGDILPYVDAARIKEFCKPDADLSDHVAKPLTRDGVLAEMREYMEFALGKAGDHRGLSANRSIDHYRAWVWLLGDEKDIDWENYTNYGVPILKQVCDRYGLPFPDDVELAMMSRGEPCSPHCDEGCS